jgi:uncharacterized protein YoxC
MTDYPALGFDPAPGDPGSVSSLANNFSTVAQHLGSARDALNTVGESHSIWQGDAANNFRGQVGQLPDYLNKANASLGDAAKTLEGWSSDLTTMQAKAGQYETQAEQALQKLQQAQSNPNLKLAGQQFNSAQALQQAQSELDSAEQALSSAQGELNAIREDAQQLLAQHESLAKQVADALRKAKDEAPEEPGLLDRLGDALNSLMGDVSSLANKVWQWTKDHAADIAEVGNLLSKISAVLGVIALATAAFEPIGAIFGAAAGITSLGALAASGLAKAAGDKDVSWGTLGIDAIGALPFIGTIAKGTKVAQLGIDSATAFSRASEAADGLGSGVKATETGLHAIAGSTIKIVGKGFVPKLLAAGESKFINGATIGSGGFNKIVNGLATFGPKLGLSGLAGLASKAVDPLSSVARGIDIGIDAAKTGGSIAYNALTGGGSTQPQSAGATFSGRLRARSGS